MRDFLIIVLLFVFTIPSIRDLLKPAAYTSHDLTNHVVRTIHMDRILKEGQIPSRWTGDLNFGYGYPLFLFNYPLPSMVASVLHNLGLSFLWSVKITLLLSMIFSAYFAYILFRYAFSSTAAGFVGGLFYLYAPIRFLNVYVSATFGNAVAFAFVPLVFWAILKVYRGDIDKKILFGSVSLAALLLSHNIMALMFLPVMFLFAFILFIKKPSFIFFKYLILLFGLGFGLSAFFILPAVFEKNLIRYDEILPDFWGTHFPTLGQLLHSHWGYGFSYPGILEDDMSFQIGLAHILVVAVSIIVIIWRFLRERVIDKMAVFFLIIFAVSVFLMLSISTPVWKTMPFLHYVQMPWRLLAISVFAATVLAGYIVWRLKNNVFLVIFLVFAVLYANRNHMRINEILDVNDDYYMRINNSTTMASEHLPKGSEKFEQGSERQSKIETSSPTARVEFVRNTSGYVVARIFSDKRSLLTFNQVYFPGWQYKIDGTSVYPTYKVSRPIPTFVIESGEHDFEAYFARTRIRLFADLVSLGSIFLLALLIYKRSFVRI